MNTAKRILSVFLCLCMLIPLCALGISADETADETLENVALGKTVEATSGTGLESVVDGNVNSYWDSTSGRTTSDSTVTVDLQGWYKLKEVTVIPYFGGRYYHFTVSVSADGDTYTLIGDKNDSTPGTNKGFTYPAPEESVRYIQVNMTKNSANPEYHICEIEAYGTLDADYKEPVITEDPNDPANIAVGKPTRANYNSFMASRVTDAKIGNRWSGNAYPQYVDVDLLANYDISEIIVYMPTIDSYTYTVYGSLDGVRFDRIAESNVKKPGTEEGEKFTFEKPVNYRVIRVNVTSAKMGGVAAVSEIKVHGKQNNTAVIPTRDKLEFTSYDEWLLKNHGVDTSKLKDADGNYNIEDTYTEADTVKALQGLVSRVLGDKYNDWFEFDVVENTKNDYDYYEISGGGSAKVKIKGNDGVAIASGLNHYLKYFCNVNVSQQTKQVAMPASAPAVGNTIRKETVCEVRYAYNYCTLSYTMQFYGFDEWQKELDYLMLQGVNVILDTTASEALWVMYLQQYGYTAQEAIDFVCGYAFKAWWLMGNLENYGGSVGDQWIYDTLEMARVNQRYMTVMGCMPCLNIFPGTMPIKFADHADAALTEMGYPNVKDYMTSTGGWCGFTRPFALNTTFPGFHKMTVDFYETQNHLYGQITDYYAGDFLHEITAGFELDPAFNKAGMSRTVLDYLLEENDEACWIMQSWWENPLPEVVEGFGDDREDHVLMLDLAAANRARWTDTEKYGGYEFGGSGWVFCMLDNYGGRTGMHGAFTHIMTGLFKAYAEAKHFKGIGITPEGTEENPVSYDFFWELIWTNTDDIPTGQTTSAFINQYIRKWVSDYANRRYGTDSKNVQEAWEILEESVYNKKTVDGTSTNPIITCEPNILNENGGIAIGGDYYNVPYDQTKLEDALRLMMKDFDELKGKETYIYDICDMMCQLLTNSAATFYSNMGTAIQKNDVASFKAAKAQYMRCMELIDEVSSYVDDTMLGNWVGRIDDWVNDERTGEYADYDIDTMKHNTLILITTWASHPSLIGYANREYAGLMNDYYLKMWREYLDRAINAVGRVVDPAANREVWFKYAWDIIVSCGEGYSREVLNPNGDDNGARSLKAIYGEICRKLLKDSVVTVNNLVLATDSTAYTIQGSLLRGVKYGMRASEVKNLVKGEQAGLIFVLDADGNPLPDNAILNIGDKIVLKDFEGMSMDTLVLSQMEKGVAFGVEKDECTLKVGDTLDTKVSYYLGEDGEAEDTVVTYTSSDPKIATVDANGIVTAVSEGVVTITATVGEHSAKLELAVTRTGEPDSQPGTGNDDKTNDTKEGGFPVWAIVVIIVVAVLAVGGVTTFVVVSKKKK